MLASYLLSHIKACVISIRFPLSIMYIKPAFAIHIDQILSRRSLQPMFETAALEGSTVHIRTPTIYIISLSS